MFFSWLLQKVLLSAGKTGNPTVFLFSDSQIKEERFLEDIDSLLNSGEVPNLFAVDEKQDIIEVSKQMLLPGQGPVSGA